MAALLALTRIDPLGMSDLASALAEAGLPIADLLDEDRRFYRVEADGVVGFAGIEGQSEDRLLRSLVVLRERRGEGHGAAIVRLIEEEARRDGAARLHLLTTTAEPFFIAQGYRRHDRANAPADIRTSIEFSTLCPAGAAYLMKPLKV